MAGQQAVPLLFVAAHLIQLRRQIRAGQLAAHRANFHRSGENALAEGRVGGSVHLQRHIQGNPRLQSRPAGQKAALLPLEPGDVLQGRVDPSADFPRLTDRSVSQELLLANGTALDEQAVLNPGVAFERVQGGIRPGQFAFRLRQGGGLPPEQGRPGRVRQLAVRLADFHAAQPQELVQEFFPAVGHRQNAELFHVYNCHFSASQPFPR